MFPILRWTLYFFLIYPNSFIQNTIPRPEATVLRHLTYIPCSMLGAIFFLCEISFESFYQKCNTLDALFFFFFFWRFFWIFSWKMQYLGIRVRTWIYSHLSHQFFFFVFEIYFLPNVGRHIFVIFYRYTFIKSAIPRQWKVHTGFYYSVI